MPSIMLHSAHPNAAALRADTGTVVLAGASRAIGCSAADAALSALGIHPAMETIPRMLNTITAIAAISIMG
jgi:hypothetical protein